jgi:hypothetical protein
MAICLIKVSVLILYLRVFGNLLWIRVACIAGMVIVVGYHASITISFGAMCAPTPALGYDRFGFLAAFVSEPCVRSRILVVIQGVGNVAIDLFLMLLPLPVVWNLQMPLKRKLQTSAMFLIGLCACISSVIGLAVRVEYFSAGSDNIWLVIPIWSTA